MILGCGMRPKVSTGFIMPCSGCFSLSFCKGNGTWDPGLRQTSCSPALIIDAVVDNRAVFKSGMLKVVSRPDLT